MHVHVAAATCRMKWMLLFLMLAAVSVGRCVALLCQLLDMNTLLNL